MTLMRSIVKKRFSIWMCLFVMLNLAAVPVVHSSMLLPADTIVSAHEVGHDCLEHLAEKESAESSATHPQDHTAPGCKHGAVCMMLCGFSVSTASFIDSAHPVAASQWVRIGPSPLQSSFRSRLDRPPRS